MKKTTDTVFSEAAEEEITATAAPQAETVEEDKIYVYLGPTIGGLIQKGSIYKAKNKDSIAEIALAVEKIPAIKKLVVQDINIRATQAKLNDGSTNAMTNAVKEIQQAAAALDADKK